MIYNFRHDKDHTDSITARIVHDRQLSQGWGGGQNEANLDINQPNFIDECVRFHELRTTHIASNLCRIRDFRDGDVLVTPHIPEYGKLSIHEIEGDFPECYTYVHSDEIYQNHRINLRNSIGLQPNQEINVYNVNLAEYCAALKFLRLPVLPIPQFESIFNEIYSEFSNNQQQDYGASKLDEFLRKLSGETVDYVIEKLRSIAPSGGGISFENLCERLLQSQGYKIVGRHIYNRKGGDVDIHCVRTRSDFSIFESGNVDLYVQIKKHGGETDEQSVQQVLDMIVEQKSDSINGCVMSAADEFSRSARKLAEDNGIVLLTKREICSLLLPLLARMLD